MKLEPENIDLRSDRVNELLGQVPHWIIRFGNVILLFVVLLLLSIAYFIKYPDVVVARITVTNSSLPHEIKINPQSYSSELSYLMVNDKQLVKKGEVLAVAKNLAVYEDILCAHEELKNTQKAFAEGRFDTLSQLFSNGLQLGEFQPAYSLLLNAIEDYRIYNDYKFHKFSMEEITKQIDTYKKLKSALLKELTIANEQFALSRNNYLRDSTLFVQQVIPASEFEILKKKYLEEKLKIENIKIQVIGYDLNIQQKEEAMLLISQDSIKALTNLYSGLNNAIMEFDSKLRSWEETYLLYSPIDGRISFNQPLKAGKYLQADKTLMMVLPDDTALFAYTYLPSAGSGKVAVGQETKIRFDGFPFQEYGVVKGKVHSISKAATEGLYYVQIKIPAALETNFHKKLEFSSNMQGDVHIITEDLRYIERIFYQFKSAFTKD